MFRSDKETSDREAGFAAFLQQRADGKGQAKPMPLPVINRGQMLSSLTPDGKKLVYEVKKSETSWDIGMLSLAGDPDPHPLLDSPKAERHACVSPDGHWLAYSSDGEVWVVPFPEVDAGIPYQISPSGGDEPLWSPQWSADGGEIYYRQGDAVWAVTLETTPSLARIRPKKLFSGSYLRSVGYRTHTYDIDPNGARFLMIRDTRENKINVVVNWLQEVQEAANR